MAIEIINKIMELLKEVKYPGYSRDIVSFGFVKNITECDGIVKIELNFPGVSEEIKNQLTHEINKVLTQLADIKKINLKFIEPPKSPTHTSQNAGNNPWAEQMPISGIRNIIAVASGKGGVGKSTVAVNLACALYLLNNRIGLLDCDIYGPSIPMMMGIKKQAEMIDEYILLPVNQYGLEIMSIGLLLNENEPIIWRGPMVQSAIKQFLKGVRWGELDYLVIDLPPGTGDAQLSLAQAVPMTGAVIVTTPQDVALLDAKKGVKMFYKINVPVLGIVENMSYFICPHCNKKTDIFSSGGGKKESEQQKVAFLGEIPLDPEIRITGDEGKPIVITQPESNQAKAFMIIAKNVVAQINLKHKICG